MKSYFIKSYLFSFILFLFAFQSHAQEIKTYSELNQHVREIYSEKWFKHIKNYTLSIYNIDRKIKKGDSLRNGIYRISMCESHGITSFLIYENKDVQFLDISNFNAFHTSFKSLMEYMVKKKYCRELQVEIISSFMSWHYNNRRITWKKENFCENAPEKVESQFDLQKASESIAKEIEKQENSPINIDDIFLYKTGFYHGIKKSEILNNNLYSYFYAPQDATYLHKYLIIRDKEIEFLEMYNDVSFIKSVLRIIEFNDKRKVCYLETLWILKSLFDNYIENSCPKNY